MAQEEKLNEAKKLYESANADQRYVLESLFPELKESEDERISENIIATIHLYYGEPLEDEAKEMIAWLEKQVEHAKFIEAIQVGDQVTKNEDGVLVNLSQLKRVAKKDEKRGEQKPNKTFDNSKLKPDSNPYWTMAPEYQLANEQKPTDKVEPKFKVGDWIIDVQGVSVAQIIGYEDDSYLIKTSCSQFYLPTKLTEMNYHLWTIQDAKSGDVLSWDGSKCITLFKNIYDEDSFSSYGLVGHCTGTFELRQSYHDIEGAHPATKEQCDFLFQKMKEAGYEWDGEKKELKKIEQKSAWSEEEIENCAREAEELNCIILAKHIRQLKSIRPQTTWKPSEAQIVALECATNDVQRFSNRSLTLQVENEPYWRNLVSLLKQLKKLMEE